MSVKFFWQINIIAFGNLFSIWELTRNEKCSPEEKNITVYAHQRNSKLYQM